MLGAASKPPFKLLCSPPRVAVAGPAWVGPVGAGPAGLPAAIAAHQEGADVTIIERRSVRSRPVWFDLEPDDGSGETSQAVLAAWGFFELLDHIAVKDERGSGVVKSSGPGAACCKQSAFVAALAPALAASIDDASFIGPSDA